MGSGRIGLGFSLVEQIENNFYFIFNVLKHSLS